MEMRKSIVLTLAVMLVFGLNMLYTPSSIGQDSIGATLKGHVYDMDTGEPLDEVMIDIWDDMYLNYISTETNETGYYEVELEFYGQLSLWAYKENYFTYYNEFFVPRGTIVTHDFEMEEIPCQIYGYVFTENGSVPEYDSLYIGLETHPDDPGQHYYTQWGTGGGGYIYYKIACSEGTFRVIAEANGYEDYFSEWFKLIKGDSVEHNITLVPMQTGVFGQLTGEDGWGLYGHVQISTDQSSYFDETDWEGYYNIQAPPGEYELRATAADHHPYEDDITIVEGELLEYNIEMVEKTPLTWFERIIQMILELIGAI
ncbi:MAG: carboxypeptidase-like regulatory domain-containing protein [Thermoplasmatota archaeon]